MIIPKKLKIGGHCFTIRIDKGMDDINGETDWDTNLIRISKTLPQNHKEAALIHEVFHVLNSTLDSTTVGHALLDSLSEQFYQVLADNKLLK